MPSTSLAALLAAAASALVATTTKQHLSCIAAARSLQSPQPGAYGSHTGDAAAAEDTPNVADYVIVGGGTAGCVLAARLCENLPDSSIVLLERAAPRTEREDLFVRSPRLFSELWGAPERSLLDVWETKPNAGLGGRKVTQLSGRTLGGSSAINGLQWTKPPLATFNGAKWAFSGLDSATAGDLYRRVERQLQVAVPPPELQHTYVPQYLAAATAVGLPTDVEPLSRTGPPSDGMWVNPLATDSSQNRVDSCTGYRPAMAAGGSCMRNLQLVQSATVAKVLIEGGRAVGVRYLQTDAPEGRQEREVAARREVISAAGPYGSPKLLQVSGIGPAALLAELGVEQVVDLPVGESTVARSGQTVADFYTAVPLAPEANTSAALTPESIAAFNAGRRSTLAVSAAAVNGVLAHEDAYAIFSDVPFPGTPEAVLTSICAVNPTARGTLRANSTDPLQLPVIDTNYLGSSADARQSAACAARLQEVHEQLQGPLGLVSALPGPNTTIDEDYARASASTVYHYVGGCPLGPVVDGEFRVVGVEGLRVVDASVMPEMPPFAGPMATVYMLAELAADTITAAHRLPE